MVKGRLLCGKGWHWVKEVVVTMRTVRKGQGQEAKGGKSNNSSKTSSNIKSQIKVSCFGRKLYWVWMGWS